MSAITSVSIENFRSFARLDAGPFSAVNLIVGANNSGKSALLEAIEAVVSEVSPFVLYRASIERGESRTRNNYSGEEVAEIDIRHWFHGHALEEGAFFEIRAAGERERFLRRAIHRLAADVPRPFVPFGLELTMDRPGNDKRLANLPLTAEDYLGAGPTDRIQRLADFGLSQVVPVGFVTTDRLFPRELARVWSKVELTPNEERVLQALRLVEPNVERVAISENGGLASAKVLLQGADGPIPLGTLGEGVTRMLTLATHLALTRGGFLFIDELENGIHWSVMGDLWKFLVETARVLNVQVFATTHSRDCLQGIATLHRAEPALANRVSVHRLERGRAKTVTLDAARIADYLEMDIEAR